MNKLYLFIFALLILFAGCKTNQNKNASLNDQIIIAKYVKQAVNGDRSANDSLSGLVDYSLPLNPVYNKLTVEKITASNGRTYYPVLLEYGNPLYNRFAVYDSALTPLLIDKSLNGRLSFRLNKINGKDYFEVNEIFLSKDVLEINRLSLYIVEKKVSITARLYTKFATPQNTFYQSISEFTSERIKTDLKSDKHSLLNGKSDIFSYDEILKIYNSETNLFDNFIKEYIKNIKKPSEKPEIHDERSALQSVGINIDADTIKNTSNISKKSGYYLTLTDGWKELKDVIIDGYSVSPLKGTRYENTFLGARIFIINLNHNPAETYFTQVFSNETGSKAKIRYTEKYESKKYYLQLFEFSCASNRYILIFEASKFTYDQYKKEYEDIINSFSMDCD